MDRARIIADGQVQGVGYRYLVRREAVKSRLLGYARNLRDGRVEVVVEGSRERIERFIDAIKVKKPPMEVSEIQVEFLKPTRRFETFTIKTGSVKEEMVEGFSTGASYFEVMFSKQDETLNEVKLLRSDLRTLLEERLARMEQDVAVIKAKLSLP